MADDKLEIPKEVTDFLGVNAESIEDFKKNFDGTFIKKDAIKDDDEIKNSIFGARVGSIETTTKSLFKKNGVELSSDDIKDKKVEEIMELGFEKLMSNHQTKITEVKEAGGKTDDQALTDLQTKYETLESTSKKSYDELNVLHEDLKSAHETHKTDSTLKLTTMQKDNQLNAIDQTIPWATDAEFFKERKASFASDFAGKYDTKLGDDGNILITNKDGDKIKNEDKAGEYMTYKDLLNKEAVQAKLIKINPHDGPAPKPKPKPDDLNNPPATVERRINRAGRD